MPIEFFDFWVNQLWGSALLSVIMMAVIFSIIGMLGRMSGLLLFTILGLFFVTFATGFLGMMFFLPIFLFSIGYFFLQIHKFLQGAD